MDRILPLQSAKLGELAARQAQTVEEPAAGDLGQRPYSLGRGDGIATVDLDDPRPHFDSRRIRQDTGCSDADVASENLAEPCRFVAGRAECVYEPDYVLGPPCYDSPSV